VRITTLIVGSRALISQTAAPLSRHVEIEKADVRIAGKRRTHGLRCVRSFAAHLGADSLQRSTNVVARRRVVVRNENS
jgi:hypothetical protein